MVQTFGTRIRQLRKAKQATQPQVAMGVGIAQGYLSDLETGKERSPSREVVRNLAAFYGVPYHELAILAWAGDDVRLAQLPGVENLPMPFVAFLQRIAAGFDDSDWDAMAEFAEGRAARKALRQGQAQAGAGYHVPEDESHTEAEAAPESA